MNVEELAEQQYGLITRAQASVIISESAIDRRVASQRWLRVRPGVFRVAGAPQARRQRAMAAALWADGVVSHASAAPLLRIDSIRSDELHVSTSRRGLLATDVSVHCAALTRIERVTVDAIPCTSATRTLLDCAALIDAEALESAFESARRMGLTSVAAVAKSLGRGRAGAAQVRRVLAAADARPKESRLEVKLARLLRSSALPAPVAQFRIGRFRVDFAWPELRVICECDGFEWHGDRLHWKRDRRRIAVIESADYRIVHVTWEDVTKHPQQTLDRLALALQRAA